MEPYSPFFQTLHDERAPTGHLGNGTHASILRAIVFHSPTLAPLTTGAPADFAIIWDEDHDTRVIKAVEAIYRACFLGSILMIGERKGTLNAIVSEDVRDPDLLKSLEDKLRHIAQKIDGDPWSWSVRTLSSPSHEIIDDRDDRVKLYLSNLNMLFTLGVKVSRRVRMRKMEEILTDDLINTIVRCVPGDSKKAEEARLSLLRNLERQIEAEKQGKGESSEKRYAQLVRTIRAKLPDLTDKQILAVIRCVPGDGQDVQKARARLLGNLEKQIKAEKAGKPFGLTAWASVEPDMAEEAALEHHQTESSCWMKVLVVDNHVLIRDAMRGVLKELRGDATVLEAGNSQQAMDIVAAEQADLGLILLDLTLPDRDGFAVLSELRECYPAIPIVVLSAQPDHDSVARALNQGARGFIPKSGQREDMLGALRLVFAGGIYIPPKVIAQEETS